MQERLNRITEEFRAANDLKREIESKEILTESDREELEIIENWLEEFRIQINEWAEDYNNQQIVSIDQPKEKTLKEQFDENRIKINEIKYESKSLQPKFDSTNKKNKHEILESLGFIETLTVDNRKIQIHPTLIGKYYDLVKEQRRLLEELKEEYYNKNQVSNDKVEIVLENEQIIEKTDNIPTKEEQVTLEEKLKNKLEKNQNELAVIIEGKGLGKKDYIKHNGVKYWIPKKYINRFRALMHEQELLSKELEKIESKKIEIEKEYEKPLPLPIIEEPLSQKQKETEDDIFKIIDENLRKNIEILEKEQKKQLPMVIEEVKKVRKPSNTLIEKIKNSKNKIIKTVIDMFKGTVVYKKYKEYLEKTQTIKDKKHEEKKLDNKRIRLERLLATINERINYMNDTPIRTPEEERELEKLQYLKVETENKLQTLYENKKVVNEEIKSIRKPKTNIKEKTKTNKKKIIKKMAVAVGVGLAIIAGLKACNNNTNNNEPVQEPIEIEKPIENNEEQVEEPTQEVEEEKYYTEDEDYKVTGQIYDNMYDASTQTNPQNPYFGENTEGYIVGWGININGEMVFVSRSDSAYKEKLENYLNAGGQITTYAMSDAENGKISEITGFYNAEQISRKSR